MSHHHHPLHTTPAGTPLEDRTVGELVAERPGRSRVFQRHQIDFCCQGGLTVRQACDRKGLSLGAVAAELAAEAAAPAEGENPATFNPVALVVHIVERHHGFLRQELPRLLAMAHRVAQVHGGHTPALVEVRDVLLALAEELHGHLRKEEEILFPAILSLCGRGEAPAPGLVLDGPLAQMLAEHEEAGGHLARLRDLTGGYQPPAEACNTYRALFAGLADLEGDLHTHIHLENHALFPQARALAERAA